MFTLVKWKKSFNSDDVLSHSVLELSRNYPSCVNGLGAGDHSDDASAAYKKLCRDACRKVMSGLL